MRLEMSGFILSKETKKNAVSGKQNDLKTELISAPSYCLISMVYFEILLNIAVDFIPPER